MKPAVSPVMAHPGLNRSDEVIAGMVDDGLDGIECFHTKHSQAMSEHYLQIAEQFGLLVTGGIRLSRIEQGPTADRFGQTALRTRGKAQGQSGRTTSRCSGQFSA
jgi:hypothetical protein